MLAEVMLGINLFYLIDVDKLWCLYFLLFPEPAALCSSLYLPAVNYSYFYLFLLASALVLDCWLIWIFRLLQCCTCCLRLIVDSEIEEERDNFCPGSWTARRGSQMVGRLCLPQWNSGLSTGRCLGKEKAFGSQDIYFNQRLKVVGKTDRIRLLENDCSVLRSHYGGQLLVNLYKRKYFEQFKWKLF